MSDINLFPIFFSLYVAVMATIIGLVFGVGIAYLLTTHKNKFSQMVRIFINLPIVLPPTVLGYYLLTLLGRTSMIGSFLESVGITIVFTKTGAIIAATIVSIPYMIRSALLSFEEIDPTFYDVGAVFGASKGALFTHITLPLSKRGILAGISLTFARAIGDFGTTLMVAGNIPNKTMTMPMEIYRSIQTGDHSTTNLLVIIMTATALAVLLFVHLLEKKSDL